MAAFFLQPITMGAWLPRIPQVQEKLGLDHATLAMALIGLAVGTLSALPFGGRLVNRFGARKIILWGYAAFLMAICLPVWAWSAPSLFGALMLVGMAMGILELGLNVEADSVEKTGGRLIMSTAHGFWSLGIMTGSLIGAVQAGLAIPPHIAVPALAALLFIPSLVLARALPKPLPSAEAAAGEADHRVTIPAPLLAGICLCTFGITATEGAVADWSAIYLRDIFAASPGSAGIGYSVFAAMVAAGRFAGDGLRRKLGPVVLARGCAALALFGTALLFLAPNGTAAIVGFGFMGIGVSVGFPLGVTAAANAPGRSAASNVALLSFTALTGFLVGPPAIGFAAEAFDIRIALMLLLPVLALSMALTGLLRPRPAPQATPQPTAAQ
nr:MFS transporter [Pelagibacterium xiamenense]